MTFIQEHLQWLNDKYAAGRDDLILKLVAKGDESRFLQLTNWTVNAFYPFEDEPATELAKLGIELPPGLIMAQWEAGEFLNLGHNGREPQIVAKFLTQYVEQVFNVADDIDEWDVTLETFDGPPRGNGD